MRFATHHTVVLEAAALAIIVGVGGLALSANQALKVRSMMRSPTAALIEAPFLSENRSAMARMMRDMAVSPTGDVDADFVAMMVPHHQGAIDMAMTVLRYGHNEKIRRLAQEIIVTQRDEIVAMRRAVQQNVLAASPHSMPAMSMR
jgi:uncharacterized protein (DUF305 family)